MENVTIDELIKEQLTILNEPFNREDCYNYSVYTRLQQIENSVDNDFRELIKNYYSSKNLADILSSLRNISKIQLLSTRRLINFWKKIR